MDVGYRMRTPNDANSVVRTSLSTAELLRWYKGYGLSLFPSLTGSLYGGTAHVNSADGQDRTRHYLTGVHRQNAALPIVGADEHGAFVESLLDALAGEALPIVVDANVLRNDIGYFCRHGRRTGLVTATNARIMRLYCAAHVFGEVEEHAARWAGEMGLGVDEYLAVWGENYVPLLRLVDTTGMEALLLPGERARIDRLGRFRDLDDVPSAVLALAMGAFFASEDGAPHEAVYDRQLTIEERAAWRTIVFTGGDSAELRRMISFTGIPPALAVWGGVALGRRLWAWSPFLLLGALALAGVLARRVPRERYRDAGQAAVAALSWLATHVHEPLLEAGEALRSALPAFPAWDTLVAGVSRDGALARACLYELARSRSSPMSARDLAGALPALGIGQAPPRVGQVLHRYGCFVEPYRGVWQLGSAIAATR
jgi:hypothetical protein